MIVATWCAFADCPDAGEWWCDCRGLVCLGHADRCLDCAADREYDAEAEAEA